MILLLPYASIVAHLKRFVNVIFFENDIAGCVAQGRKLVFSLSAILTRTIVSCGARELLAGGC